MKVFVVISLALLFVLSCGVVTQAATPPTPQIIVITVVPPPAEVQPTVEQPTAEPTKAPKPAPTKSNLTFESTFMMPNGQNKCNYYVTGNGFPPNMKVFLLMGYRFGNFQYEPMAKLTIKTDGNGHFSYYLIEGFDFATYWGRWIKTTAYDQEGNIIAEAEQQALGCE